MYCLEKKMCRKKKRILTNKILRNFITICYVFIIVTLNKNVPQEEAITCAYFYTFFVLFIKKMDFVVQFSNILYNKITFDFKIRKSMYLSYLSHILSG